MVENAAAVLSAKSGWNQKQSVEYIENMIFNSDEDIPGLLSSILNGSFEFHPPVRIRRGTAKREKRDLWKAPRWVKEIGIGALVVSAFATLLGLLQVFDVLQRFGDVSTAVLCGGLKVLMIPFFYGLIVYFISLVIRVIQKPRI